jgi:hypothetical protein
VFQFGPKQAVPIMAIAALIADVLASPADDAAWTRRGGAKGEHLDSLPCLLAG